LRSDGKPIQHGRGPPPQRSWYVGCVDGEERRWGHTNPLCSGSGSLVGKVYLGELATAFYWNPRGAELQGQAFEAHLVFDPTMRGLCPGSFSNGARLVALPGQPGKSFYDCALRATLLDDSSGAGHAEEHHLPVLRADPVAGPIEILFSKLRC